MFSANELTMRFGGKILFRDASLQLLDKNHYGLVGPNGSGKSTLLKIFSGDVIPDKGEIALPAYKTIGALKQDHFLYETHLIRDVVLMGKPPLWKAIQRKHQLLERHQFTESDCDELAQCEKAIEEHHGYSAASSASQLLEGLGIATKFHENPMSVLSGGYKLRVLLAQLLFSAPDVLLLDEPTNHLDIFSIRWLEEYLQSFPGILLLCSHDRHFLNAVCNHIVDIDYGTITTYKGNYDAFEKAKADERVLKELLLAKKEKRKEEMMGFVDRFGAKATKARQAQSRLKMIEKLDDSVDIELLPSTRRYPQFHFDICRPSGAFAIKVDSLGKSYGEKRVLHDVTFDIERGERVAFIGANGIGKSTLLETLMGHLPVENGSFSWGFATFTAYFPQDHTREVSGRDTLLDWLGQFDTSATREQLQKILALALFSGDDVAKPVNILSGGETARLILAKMMLVKHNVLLFDEPTNHLDMEATETLIEALKNYAGTIFFVSHNRHFVENIATRIVEMTAEGINDFKCTYAEYIEKREIDLLDAAKSLRNPLDDVVNRPADGKETYKDQKRQQRNKDSLQKKIFALEKKCHELEQALNALNERLCSEGFYLNASKEEQGSVLKEKERLESELARVLEDWEAASEAMLENSNNNSNSKTNQK